MSVLLSHNHIIYNYKTNIIHNIIINTRNNIHTYIIVYPTISAINQAYSYYKDKVDVCTEDKIIFEIKTNILLTTYKHLLYCLLQQDYVLNDVISYIKNCKTLIFADCNEFSDTSKDNEWELIIMLIKQDIQLVFLELSCNNNQFKSWVKKWQNRIFDEYYTTTNFEKRYIVDTNSENITLLPYYPNKYETSLLYNSNILYKSKIDVNIKIKELAKYVYFNKKLLPMIISNYSIIQVELMSNIFMKEYNYLDISLLPSLHKILQNEKYNIIRTTKEYELLYPLLVHGVSYYHSSMSQTLRNLVETLLHKSILKIIISTDCLPNNTYKLKSLLFTSFNKFDGSTYKYITTEMHKKNRSLLYQYNLTDTNYTLCFSNIIYYLNFYNNAPHISKFHKIAYRNKEIIPYKIIRNINKNYSNNNIYMSKYLCNLVHNFDSHETLQTFLNKGFNININYISDYDYYYNIKYKKPNVLYNIIKHNSFVNPLILSYYVDMYSKLCEDYNTVESYIKIIILLLISNCNKNKIKNNKDSLYDVYNNIVIQFLFSKNIFTLNEIELLCRNNNLYLHNFIICLQRLYILNKELYTYELSSHFNQKDIEKISTYNIYVNNKLELYKNLFYIYNDVT